MVYVFRCEDSLKYLNLSGLFLFENLETEWLAGWFVYVLQSLLTCPQ